MKNIRNFCVIAHIDHGKSTLSDRLLEHTQTISERDMKSQTLDDMDLERERGITIKSHAIQLYFDHPNGTKYTYNPKENLKKDRRKDIVKVIAGAVAIGFAGRTIFVYRAVLFPSLF